MRNLRERLEEEHQALLTREQDKAALELRIARLTKLILHSTRMSTSTAAARKQRMSLLRSFSEHMCPTVRIHCYHNAISAACAQEAITVVPSVNCFSA